MKQTEDKGLWESIGDCRITTVGRQHWRKRIYSYESRPRPDHGLFLVTRGSVEFATRDTSLFAYEGALMLLPKGCHYKALFKGTTEDLLVKAWGYNTETDLNSVWLYISYLRKRLSALNSKVEIVSKRNIGYKLEYRP